MHRFLIVAIGVILLGGVGWGVIASNTAPKTKAGLAVQQANALVSSGQRLQNIKDPWGHVVDIGSLHVAAVTSGSRTFISFVYYVSKDACIELARENWGAQFSGMKINEQKISSVLDPASLCNLNLNRLEVLLQMK